MKSACIRTKTPIIAHKPPTRSSDEWQIWNVIEKNIDTSDSNQDKHWKNDKSVKRTVNQSGGCHCGAIRFKCQMPSRVIVWDCNCSDCRLRRNAHIVIPSSDLQFDVNNALTSMKLKEYRWGTGQARHYFCPVCGISPFYVPRSNPDGYAVTFACLDAENDENNKFNNVEVRRFDGVHWEDFIKNEGKDITGLSEK